MIIPPWLSYARTLNGIRELPGAANNSKIMAWAKALGAKVLGIVYNSDATPWCGLFVAHVMAQSGLTPPKIAVRASAWGSFGKEIADPAPGAVAVFVRPGGGHVGLVVGVSSDGRLLRILGGNQSDMVCETWIERSRLTALRWPVGQGVPQPGKPVVLSAKGGVISGNEA